MRQEDGMKTETYRVLVLVLLAAVLGVGMYGLTRSDPTPVSRPQQTTVCVEDESGYDSLVLWGDC